MAYGLNPRLFVEDGPTIQAARRAASRGPAAARAWLLLDEKSRLDLIEKALRTPANDDHGDGLPAAL